MAKNLRDLTGADIEKLITSHTTITNLHETVGYDKPCEDCTERYYGCFSECKKVGELITRSHTAYELFLAHLAWHVEQENK